MEVSPYQQGMDEFTRQKEWCHTLRKKNPYPKGTDDYTQWADGWEYCVFCHRPTKPYDKYHKNDLAAYM
jgi:hypothetical protein